MGNHSTKSQNVNRDHRPKKNVHWKSAEPPSSPGKPIQIFFDDSPDALAIKWERPYTDGGSPIIGYLLEQRRVGSPSWVKTSTTLLPYPEITLTGIDPASRFQFRVFAQNVVGISESSPISDPISLHMQPTTATAPQFLNELQNAVVLENDQCEFQVSVIGSPTPQINWFKDGFEIFSSRRTKIMNDVGSSTLIFHQIALTDEGEIKCTATNRYGHVVTRFQLRIDAPPKIRLPRQYEDGYLIEAGEIIKLKVGIAGRPTPAISWSHNGDIINNDKRCEITTNDKNSFLKINKATRKDRGEYNVRAINKLGEFNASFLVTVTAKPFPPQNIRITMSLGKSVTLTWNPPEDDGGCKIGNYIVEYFRLGWDVWLKASSTRQLTTTLNDLIEGSEYKFRVKAESPYGLSEPSEESRILFIPDPKRGILSPGSRTTRHSTLSPQFDRRNTTDTKFNDQVKKSSSINQIIIPDVPKNVEFNYKIYDNEQIVKELSYGTNIDQTEPIPFPRQKPNSISNHMNKSSLNKVDIESKPGANTKEIIAHNSSNEQKMYETINIDKNKLESHNNDEVHTSNEYMLVLYDDDKKEKADEEKNQFDLDLKEAIDAPPLSLSTPDLHDLSHHNSFQPLRRSASSSELLYEKAMQRFYQAVELDEAEMARKRSQSVEPNTGKKLKSLEQTLQRKEYSSLGALDKSPEDRAKVEQVSEIESNHSGWESDDNRDLRKEIIESQQKRTHTPREPLPDVVYDDDYTESTASSASNSISASVESIEQFINSVRSATTTNPSTNATNVRAPVNDELETYHPRMEVRALSPYRSPEPGQATVILNKPVPLPDPDIKPKSILKRRTSNENNTNDVTTNTALERDIEIEIKSQSDTIPQQQEKPQNQQSSPQTQPNSVPTTPKREKEKRSFLNLFSKKTTSTENLRKPLEPPLKIERRTTEKAAEKQKATQTRQSSVEENKVEQVAVIDHYSDIVRELGNTKPKRKSSLPLYMDNQALREAADRADREEREMLAKQEKEHLQNALPELSKMNVTEDEDAQYMLEVAKKMSSYTDSSELDTVAAHQPPRNDLVEISVEHTKSVSYAVRQIKQPDTVASNEPMVFQADAKTLTESRRFSNENDPNCGMTNTNKQETITKLCGTSRSRQLGRKSISELRSQSKSPVSERKTSLSSTVLTVTRMPISNSSNDIGIDLEQPASELASETPMPPTPEPRCEEPKQMQTDIMIRIRAAVNYTIDLILVLFACYLYIFRDARLAIPVLVYIMYRQVKSDKWTRRKSE